METLNVGRCGWGLAALLAGCSSAEPPSGVTPSEAAAPYDAAVTSSPPTSADASAPTLSATDASAASTSNPECGPTLPPADPSAVTMAPAFAGTYATFVLGPLPGLPPSRLGGTILSPTDPNELLVATESEASTGAIARVRVKRDACGHIAGFDGDASILSNAPFVDANLLLGPNGVLFYSQWPVNKLSEIPTARGWAATYTVDLSTIGVAGGGPGGIGFVPPNLDDPGGLRAVAWSSGNWYHLTYEAAGDTFAITSSRQTVTLPNAPGGFAYVPQGSPGFAKQGVITCEWGGDKVVVYDVDRQGDPAPETRVEFFTKFPKPWGAYFEPRTGDFIFLTWAGGSTDQLYVVRGFSAPPPPPPAPR